MNDNQHIILGGQGYQVRGYTRRDQSTFIPRLGSGDQTESEFDLLRSSTIKGFSGGELQRFWNDKTSVYGIQGMYNKYDDGVLYPEYSLTTDNGEIYGTTKAKVLCHVRSGDYLFTAYTTYASPTTCAIIRYDKNGTATALTLPTSLSNSLPTAMVIHNNQLWIFAGGTTTAIWYMALSATTVTEITGGSGYVTLAVSYRGEIYGTSGGDGNRVIYRYTGSTSTRSWENVGDTSKGTDPTANLFVYNNRIILTRKDGMYGYDGILLQPIEDLSNAENNYNYFLPAVLKGYLYYFMPDGYYRFNGSLIEKLYDKSETGFPVDVTFGGNKLWYVYDNSPDSGSSRYDKSMGYDYSTGDLYQGRIANFNGQGFYTYGRTTAIDKSTITSDFVGQGNVHKIIYFNDKVYVTTNMTKTFDNLHVTDTASTSNDIVLTTSIFDAGFSQIQKNFENIELEFDGDVIAGEVFDIEYRIDDFEGDTGWQTLGTITTPETKLSFVNTFVDTNPRPLLFTNIHFRITGTMTNSYGIKKIITRYIFAPTYKRQWNMTLLCYDQANLNKPDGSSQTYNSQYPARYRDRLYKARAELVPVEFVDIDTLVLPFDITDVITSIPMTNNNLFNLLPKTGYIQIADEIIFYDGINQSGILQNCIRGVLDTTPSEHTSGELVNIVYRVIVRSIDAEQIIMDQDEDISVTDKGYKDYESEITITLQEV